MALFNAASMILDSPAGPSGPAGSPVGPSPFGLDAANLLRGMHAVAEPENNEALSNDLRRLSQALSQDDDEEEAKAAGNNGGVSRKDIERSRKDVLEKNLDKDAPTLSRLGRNFIYCVCATMRGRVVAGGVKGAFMQTTCWINF